MFGIVFFTLQRLLVPKYASGAMEGGLIREYYRSNFDHDIIFIGDCELYANFSPITLWEEFGITSHHRGGPQQLIWQSYYLFEETLRFEIPRVVVFSALSMQYNEPQDEAYNRLNLDGMRWSTSKFRSINASMTEEEGWLSYIFPFFRFKDRWRELSREDIQFFLRNPRVSINGFMIRSDVQPRGWTPLPELRRTYYFGDTAFYYLGRMAQLAAEHNIHFVLVKAPVAYPYWPRQWNEQMVEYAEQNNLLFINLIDYIEEIGLNFATHTFNGGLHLNVFGAEKAARFLGGILQEHFDLPDRRNEPETALLWDEKSALYHRIIARQLEEIANYGRIQNFLIN